MDVTSGTIGIGLLILASTLTVPSTGATAPDRRSAGPVAATIAVKIDGVSLRMLVDTGAQRSCLDPGALAKLRIATSTSAAVTTPYSSGSASEVHVRKLEIASLRIENLPMIAMDMSAMSSASGLPLDGILGTDVLKLMPMKLDLSKGFAEPASLAAMSPHSILVELQEVNALFYCSTVMQGIPVRLLLDTGANLSNISSAAWKRVTADWVPPTVIRGIRSSGGSEEASLVLVPNLTMGKAQLHDLAMRVQPTTASGLYADRTFEGLLGTSFLEAYSVTLDLAHSRMFLSPRRKDLRENLLFSTIGIQFAKDADGAFQIMAVWKPSPAAVAGLQVGDRILEVNGSDGRTMTIGELSQRIHQPPGTKVQLLIDSHGSVHLAELTVQCLFCAAKPSRSGNPAYP